MTNATDQITLTIDGKTVTAPKGTVVVDAARSAGIEIPVFCYHEKLGPFGCCRMCLVEVEKMPKLATACTQMVAPDMVVKTDTPKVVKGRQGVLEFTLLNHPLDCPVCDKGGECPLQDNTFKYGPGDTRMIFSRAHNDKATPLSPVITLDRERCIACQRCTRYSEIIEKDEALVMLNRGFHNEIGTFNDQPYDTRFSGNVIDICPVGALTNSLFRFKARTWDLTNTDTLCAHCGCNCNMTLGSRLNKLMRVVTRPNDSVDDGWICDKARFGYDFVESANRITQARVSEGGGSGKTLPVKEACEQIAESIKKIVEEHGADSVGFIGSPWGTNEELYLYQKLMRLGVGTNNIDHKTYADTPGLPVNHYDFEHVETSNLVLLIASDPTEELPILDLRIKKAVTRRGVKLAVLNDQQTLMDKYACQSLRYNIGSDSAALLALANEISRELGLEIASEVKNVKAEAGVDAGQIKSLAELIRISMKVCVVYNPAALTGGSSIIKHLLSVIGKIPTIECGAIPAAPGTNALGAMDMGALPGYYPGGVPVSDSEKISGGWGEKAPLKPGLSALDMMEKVRSGELKALFVHRANPVVDFPGGREVKDALKNLDLLVVHDMLETETTRIAHVVIPSNGPGYDDGTTTNIGARVQLRKGGLNTENPPDWKIISMLLNALGDECKYQDALGVTAEIAAKVPGYGEIKRSSIRKTGKNRDSYFLPNGGPGVMNPVKDQKGALRLRIAHFLFANDKILEKESHLRHHFKPSTAYLHESDAGKLGLKEGDEVKIASNGSEINARVEVSDACNPGGVVLPKVSDEQGVFALANRDGSLPWVTIRKS